MPEMHLVDPIVKKYSACGPFKNKNKEFKNLWRQVI